MEKVTEKYRLSIYTEVLELSKDKIYIVKSSLNDKIYIKKILEIDNYKTYKEIKKLDIDNIPEIYEIIKLDNKLVIIEEYINGYSLKEVLDESRLFSENEVIKQMLNLMSILEQLHSSASVIIHRDIKPSNIMINNDGLLKLIDFDISRTHKTDKSTDTHILGTYGYAAPEQFGFKQSDVRTDIYSIGVTMNMLLTGKLPMEELYKGELSNIISKCIELDSKKRFQDINEFKNVLLKKQKKYNEKNKNHHKNLKLPGFNSNRLIFKITGFLWYTFLIIAILGFFEQEAISKDRIESIIVALLLFSLTFLYGNYKDLRTRLPIIKSKNLLIKIFGYVLYTILLLIVVGITIPN